MFTILKKLTSCCFHNWARKLGPLNFSLKMQLMYIYIYSSEKTLHGSSCLLSESWSSLIPLVSRHIYFGSLLSSTILYEIINTTKSYTFTKENYKYDILISSIAARILQLSFLPVNGYTNNDTHFTHPN